MNLWIFDNDGTLYDDFGAGNKFMEILIPYTSSLMQIPINQTEQAINELKQKWNTEFSVLALVKELNIDLTEIVNNTYLKIDLSQCHIAPNPTIKQVLSRINSPKIVFTNNPSDFARYVLSFLELTDQFIDFVGMEETNFHSKPSPVSYKTVEEKYPQYTQYLFCDDSIKNLDAAQQAGWTTFWLKPSGSPLSTQKHTTIDSLADLEKYL
jgi:HAD superfamily hydrolase (TIGR01509 family)